MSHPTGADGRVEEAREPEPGGGGKGRRLVRRVSVACAVLLLTLLATVALAVQRWPGVSRRLVDQAQEATLAESRNLFACITYWLHFMEKLRPLPPDGVYGFLAPDDYGDQGLERCQTLWHRGDFAPAADCVETIIEQEGESEEALFWLGMSYLRLGETQNCLPAAVGGHGGAGRGAANRWVCALPLSPHRKHAEPARRAAAAFERLLQREGDDHLVRWLLNFSAMAAGDWPQGVAEEQRVDTPFIDRFYGGGAQCTRQRFHDLVFEDRAAALGVAVNDAGRGVAVEDFDGDGWLDLVTAGAFESLHYFRNRGGDLGFEDVTAASGLAGVMQPFSVTAADFDDDGWLDLFVARPFQHYALFRNVGGGRFEEVTEDVGLWRAGDRRIAATWTAAWGDLDLDGDLDLFLAQWGMALPFVDGLLAQDRMDSTLFLNQHGHFVDVTARFGLAGLVADEYFVGADFGDFDGDGWPDLFLSSPVRGASALLRNQHGEGFEPIALPRRESGFYAAWVDIDHDGRLDLFQAGFGDARTSTEQTVFGLGRDEWRSGHSTLLLQAADGSFAERNDLFAGAASPMGTMGAGWGDLDNDGCHDFYLGTGNPEGWFLLPNLLYVGLRDGRRCSGRMTDASVLAGFATIQKGHGIVFFDFDGDGDQDVYSALGGMWPADAWPNQLFVNESHLDRSWMAIRLRGRRSNHFGVGARIRVAAKAADGTPIVRTALIGNGTGFGSAPYLAHVGLLDAVAVESVEVSWPASHCTARYRGELKRLNVFDEAACLDNAGPTPSRR